MGLDPDRRHGPDGDFDFSQGKVLGTPDDGEPTDRFGARCDCGDN